MIGRLEDPLMTQDNAGAGTRTNLQLEGQLPPKAIGFGNKRPFDDESTLGLGGIAGIEDDSQSVRAGGFDNDGDLLKKAAQGPNFLKTGVGIQESELTKNIVGVDPGPLGAKKPKIKKDKKKKKKKDKGSSSSDEDNSNK